MFPKFVEHTNYGSVSLFSDSERRKFIEHENRQTLSPVISFTDTARGCCLFECSGNPTAYYPQMSFQPCAFLFIESTIEGRIVRFEKQLIQILTIYEKTTISFALWLIAVRV